MIFLFTGISKQEWKSRSMMTTALSRIQCFQECYMAKKEQ
jgi:hypothetical protein